MKKYFLRKGCTVLDARDLIPDLIVLDPNGSIRFIEVETHLNGVYRKIGQYKKFGYQKFLSIQGPYRRKPTLDGLRMIWAKAAQFRIERQSASRMAKKQRLGISEYNLPRKIDDAIDDYVKIQLRIDEFANRVGMG